MQHWARARHWCTMTGRTRTRSCGGSMAWPWRRTPGMCMRHVSVLAVVLLFATAAFAADDLAVDVQNASQPTLCAEEDNVYVRFASPEVRQFKIEAVHPNYIGTIVVDRSVF